MSPQTIFIDADTGTVTLTNADSRLPSIRAIRGTTLRLHVGFHSLDSPIAHVSGTTGKLAVKLPDAPTGSVLLLDSAWAVSGTGTATRYVFEVVVDNSELAALLAGKPEIMLSAQVEWRIAAEATPRRSLPFPLRLYHGPSQTTDGLPTAALDLAWEWLKAALVGGANVALTANDTTKVLTIAAAGGSGGTTDHGGLIGLGDDDHTQYHNNARGDARYSPLGHTHTKDQVGLANADNTSDATKQAATLVAAALRFLDFANAQSITHAQRRQITANAGLDVTLHAELIGPATTVTVGGYFAFTLPREFRLHAAYLTFALDTESGSALITGALSRENIDGTSATNLATFDGAISAGRIALMESADAACAMGSRILVNVSAVTPPYTGELKGLSLWLHGFWA